MGFSSLSSHSKIGLIVLAVLLVAVILALIWVVALLSKLISNSKTHDKS